MEDRQPQPRGTATLPSPRNPSEKRSSTPGALRPPSLRLQNPRSAVNQVRGTGENEVRKTDGERETERQRHRAGYLLGTSLLENNK